MDAPTPPSLFDRLVWPPALFAGVVAAFAACCLAGHHVSRHNHFRDFERFHVMIAPESLYYPTARQVRALARDRLDPDKVVVIVGGSSVLNGTMQRGDEIWTRKLQALLGEDFQVLNLGFRGAQPVEFGAVAAEFLGRDFPRLILLTDLQPGGLHPEADGMLWKYFFWDAHAKGLLLPHPERDAYLAEMAAEVERLEQARGVREVRRVWGMTSEQRQEVRTAMRLDAGLYFNELWHTLGYTTCCTVWSSYTRESFPLPRRRFPDVDAGPPPPEQRFVHNTRAVPDLRELIRVFSTPDGKGGLAVKAEGPFWDQFRRQARAFFPEPCRPRTLLVVKRQSAYFLRQLTPDEQARYNQFARETARALTLEGFAAVVTGEANEPCDYGDLEHLTASGGAKLAAEVAPQVRALAERLGYTKGGGRCR